MPILYEKQKIYCFYLYSILPSLLVLPDDFLLGANGDHFHEWPG